MLWILDVLHSADDDVRADEDSHPLEEVQVLEPILHLLTVGK